MHGIDTPTWIRRGRLLLAAFAATGTAALAGTAATAGALTTDLNCTASGRILFSPKLNGGPSSASISARVAQCVSLNGSSGFLKSGAISATGMSATGCFPVFSLSGPVSITWNDGSTSTVAANLSTNPLNGLVIDVTVTAGRMYGDSVTPAGLIFVPGGLGCGLGGTSSLDVTVPQLIFSNNRSAATSRNQRTKRRTGRAGVRRNR